MSFTVEEFHDLIRLLEDKPEWRAELRRMVLTDELLALPEKVARLVDAQRRTGEEIAALTRALHELTDEVKDMKADMGRLDSSVEEMKADMGTMKADIKRLDGSVEEMKADMGTMKADIKRLDGGVARLDASVGDLKGESLEVRYRQRAASYLGRIVRRIQTLSTDELSALLDDAIDQGHLTVAEKDEVMLADLVVLGKRREDNAVVYLVVEISWGIGPYDAERAVQRAALLSKVDIPALPVVAGQTIIPEAAQLARTLRVWQVTDGRAVSPEPS